MESGPKTSAQLFSDILKLQNEGSLPPVDDWNPPLCENVQMKISRDGKWYFMDSPIGREKMVSLFSTVLRFDEDGNYYLVTPVEKIRIEVEDKPFVIVTYQKEIKNDKDGNLSFSVGRKNFSENNLRIISLRIKELGLEDTLINSNGLTPGMLVTLGEQKILKLEDFADLASDELTGGYDVIKGERVKIHGYLEDFALSKEEADTLIMSARNIVYKD